MCLLYIYIYRYIDNNTIRITVNRSSLSLSISLWRHTYERKCTHARRLTHARRPPPPPPPDTHMLVCRHASVLPPHSDTHTHTETCARANFCIARVHTSPSVSSRLSALCAFVCTCVRACVWCKIRQRRGRAIQASRGSPNDCHYWPV